MFIKITIRESNAMSKTKKKPLSQKEKDPKELKGFLPLEVPNSKG